MKKFIYADNAATTALDKNAFQEMLPFLQDEYGNASGPYSFSRFPKKAIAKARQTIANCINASPDEIFFTSGGTEADNWAIKGAALKNKNKGNHIITSSFEHHAVLQSCSFLGELGFDITYLPADTFGHVSSELLNNSLQEHTILTTIMLANNEIGTIQYLYE